MIESDQIFNQLKHIIAVTYGFEENEIQPDWDLAEDLGFFNSSLNNPEDDWRFIQRINQNFGIELDIQIIKSMFANEELETLDDLIELIDEELINAL